jgi:HPt (histidine-containing phosphotransfer) domain-containing protein
MPELDGFQVIQAVRDHERAAGGHLPVIALTARARREDRERCLAAGMDDFLAKPIQATNLWAAIDQIVTAQEEAGSKVDVRGLPYENRGSRIGDSGASGASYGPGTGAFTRPARLDPRSSILDPRALLAACGGDAVILEKICQAFRAGLPDHWRAVQDALQARDAPRLREAAHKLCGIVSAFSTVAGQAASELEDCAAQGLLEEARPLVGRLEPMIQELLQVVVGLSLDALREQQATTSVSSSRATE